MKFAVLELVGLIWLRLVLGPAMAVHEPVPTAGEVAPKASVLAEHMVWSPPALAALGEGFTVITTSSWVGLQPARLVVQRNVYTPAPPAAVKVEVGEVVLLNWVERVDGLLGRAVQAPVPGLAELAAKAPPVTHMVLSGPALAVAAGAFTVITT